MARFKYNAGDAIGPYNIIMQERTFKDKNKKWHGNFICPYDNQIFDSTISHIQQGLVVSCGCYNKQKRIAQGYKNKKDIVGWRFGKLKVISDSGKRSNSGCVIWNCICDCNPNRIVKIDSSCLLSGSTNSCGCLKSKGEQIIQKILFNMNINFLHDTACFKDCKNPKTNRVLRFDFYLPDYNCCIEYDGKQHFQEVEYFKESLAARKYKDQIKDLYCKNNDIRLIRISYKDLEKINEEYLIKKIEKE